MPLVSVKYFETYDGHISKMVEYDVNMHTYVVYCVNSIISFGKYQQSPFSERNGSPRIVQKGSRGPLTFESAHNEFPENLFDVGEEDISVVKSAED